MPKKGGYLQPLAFVVAMGVAGGIIHAALSLILLTIMPGARMGAMAGMAAGMEIVTIILFPIMMAIGSFIGAAILFVIWKLMGSEEDYETAYRCGAYGTALTPIYVLINLIPIAGPLVSIVISLYILITASVEVHKLPARKSWIVFGTIDAVIIALSILLFGSAYFMAKRFAPRTAGGPAFTVPAATAARGRALQQMDATIKAMEDKMKTMPPAQQAQMQRIIDQMKQAREKAASNNAQPAAPVASQPASTAVTPISAAAKPAPASPVAQNPAAAATSHASRQPAAAGAVQPASGTQNPAVQQMDATIKAMEDRLNSLPPEQQVQMRRMIDQMKQARAKAASQ